MKKLEGKVALITGGASGIGKALGEDLAGRGCEVVLADRQFDVAQEVARSILAKGGKASAIELDVRDSAAFARAAETIVRRSGRIDYFFNNAGIAVGGLVENYEDRDWDDTFDVNLRGVAYGIQAVYPHMIQQGFGHIVNTASVAGLLPASGTVAYTATKHAVVGLSKAMRVEAARHGVRVSVLCPGAIRTPILTGGKYGRRGFEGVSTERILEQWQRIKPISAEELARRTVDDMLANKAIIVHPRWWRLVWLLDRISPAISAKISEGSLKQLLVAFKQEGVKPRPPKTTPVASTTTPARADA